MSCCVVKSGVFQPVRYILPYLAGLGITDDKPSLPLETTQLVLVA